ncbi:hypothetical protein KAU11_08675 [Candidatus Babeliales bacterium]|nr:hypothetical protein [Candidatus Babeliales bacterium]
MFYNELDLLDIRLHELYDTVDRFVLCESLMTHSGAPKNLVYADNKSKFEDFNDKIIHIVVDELKGKKSGQREEYHRQQIMRGLEGCTDTDIIIFGDADEIAKKEVCVRHPKIVRLGMDFYYYYFNTKINGGWKKTRKAPYRMIKNVKLSNIRANNGFDVIPNAGWHFSFIGGVDNIRDKMIHFKHGKMYSKDVEKKLEARFAALEDPYGRDQTMRLIKPEETLPEYIYKNLDKFDKYIRRGY